MPKLFAGEYGAEISTLLTSKSQALHTSFWDGDLESFIYQSQRTACRSACRSSAPRVESVIWRPQGQAAGRHHRRRAWRQRPARSGQHLWGSVFKQVYMDRYGSPPNYPAYQMALSILGLKTAWDAAQKKKNGKPSTDEIIASFEGISVRTRRAAP